MASPHAEALQAKHHEIDEMIETEAKRPAPDMTRIADLKKRKLRLKEELSHS